MGEKEFNILYLEHKDAITGYVYKRVKDMEISRDITHDVFTKLYSAIRKGEYKEFGYFKNYLYTLAHNETLNYLQSYTYKDSKNKWDNMWLMISSPDDVHVNYCAKETLDIVVKLVSTLTQENSSTFNLRYFECMQYKEIAEKLGVPIGTIKSRIFACDKFLQAKGFTIFKHKKISKKRIRKNRYKQKQQYACIA